MNQEAITYGLRGTKHGEVPSNLNFLRTGAPPHTTSLKHPHSATVGYILRTWCHIWFPISKTKGRGKSFWVSQYWEPLQCSDRNKIFFLSTGAQKVAGLQFPGDSTKKNIEVIIKRKTLNWYSSGGGTPEPGPPFSSQLLTKYTLTSDTIKILSNKISK